jgi:GNAT superfamily N-acetyltransferase
MRKGKAKGPPLVFRPLTPRLMDELGRVLRGSWGTGCWCMYPRLTATQTRELPGPGTMNQRRRDAMTKLARRRRAPGLLAFVGEEPVGWIAIAPRTELARIETSRATLRVDNENVWVIPCVTVSKTARGRGIALALIRAAVGYAAQQGAPAVEAYPRAGATRTGDDNAYFGTEPLFRRAGFQVIQKPRADRPRNWVPRVTMRIRTAERPSRPRGRWSRPAARGDRRGA